MSRKEAIDSLVDLKGNLTRGAASRHLTRRVLAAGSDLGIIKKRTQKLQATTADRTNINIPQQYRWHTLVESLYAEMRVKNTGVCRVTGKTFGELIPHFIVGLDEMCLLSDAHGDLRVIGAANKSKHEAMIADRYVSLICVCTFFISFHTSYMFSFVVKLLLQSCEHYCGTNRLHSRAHRAYNHSS